MNFNPYLVLDVPTSADFESLRAAYRRLARENHPDIAPDKLAATERMAQINRAWAILNDATKRAAFDAQWQLHLAEQARREMQLQETARQEATRREAVQRESLRRQTLRAGREGSKSAKSSARATKSSPAALNAATSRGTSKLRPKSAGNAAPRATSTSASTSRAARDATPRDASSHATASRSGRTFAEETSPRALRLMRKVTLAARNWHRDGNARPAIETCRAVLLADGRNVAARELLAEIFASQNRHELAVMMLDQAIQIAPDDRFLRNKRERLEIARAPISPPRPGSTRPGARPGFWQRLRARLGAKIG